jgi:hypothetical protein
MLAPRYTPHERAATRFRRSPPGFVDYAPPELRNPGTRDEWIGVHKESDYQQVRLETSETDVHTYDHAGIRFDVVDSECTYKGETIAGRFRVTQVWVTDHQKWRLAAVQYTSLS